MSAHVERRRRRTNPPAVSARRLGYSIGIANAIYVVADQRWLRALGEIVTTSIGLAALIRLWTVWPFDFGTTSVDWDLVTRVVLGLGIGGSVIAIVVSLVSLLRGSADRP